MSEQDVENVRGAYAEWARGNFWTPDVFHPDVEVLWQSPDATVTHGLGALAAGWKEWLAPWEDCTMEAERIVPVGGQVVVVARFRGRARGSGVPVESRRGFVWTMRDGRAVRLAGYTHPEDAFAAVGLGDRAT